MKNFLTLVFCCFIFFPSFGQDSTRLLLSSGFKIHLSTGGAFFKNIETEYLGAAAPLVFVEGGIEIGRKFNVEFNLRRGLGSADTLNLNFTQVHFGVNNKSQLNENLTLVLRVGGGAIFEGEDYGITRSIMEDEIKFLRVGGGLEQKIYKESVMMLNIGYDISNSALFNGLGISVGVKFGIAPNTRKKNNVPYL
ncbi:MAG: hypothetical protein AB8F94_29815 [Saprospiraceae bacterium]